MPAYNVNMNVQTNNIQLNVTLNAVIPSVNQQLIEFTADDDKFEIKDRDGFPIFRIDAKGNVYTRRNLKRI